MTDRELIRRVYKEYPCEYKPYAEKLFQKRVTDTIGTKYFINIYKYPATINHHTGKKMNTAYEYEVQLNTNNEKENTVNIHYFSDWNIDDVEANIEEIFATGKWAYYDDE